MYSTLIKEIMYPLLEIRNSPEERTISHLKFLEKSQWWSYEELKQFQQKKMRVFLEHAYNNTVYYHRIFNELKLKPADIKNETDLLRLPILTKEDIRTHFNELIAQNYSKNKLISSATSGSTGQPMRFYKDKRWTAWNSAAAYREWSWAGYNLGDKIVYLWMSLHHHSHNVNLRSNIVNMIRRIILLDASNMTEKIVDEYIKILKNYKPAVINSYASAAYLLSQYVEKKGIEDIKPRAVLTSAENLFHYQRNSIENAFGCEVFDYYSGRDTTLHAGECSEHTGYHLAIENAVAEFIKDDEAVTSGELGKIIITDFSTYAMPFIRYEIGDLGKPSDEKCACGRGLPLMKEVLGRIRDIVTTKDGSFITGAFFSTLFYEKTGRTKGIDQFQFIQKTKEFSLLKIVKGKNFSQNELNQIIEKIKQQCIGMNIDIEFVDSIAPTKSGKYRSVMSEVGVQI